MALRRWITPKWLLMFPLVAVLIVAVACGDDATPVPQVIEKEVIKEVPVEVIKEVSVEVEKEVIKEVKVEVPVTVLAVATPTPGAPVMAKETTRLRFVTEAPWVESVLAWIAGTWPGNLVARNHVDQLLDTDNRTAELKPGLATSWEMTSPDAKQWTFKLRRGVPFSHDWGEFTAKDVRHVVDRNTDDAAFRTSEFFAYFGRTERAKDQSIRIVDDYTVELNLKIAEPSMDYYVSLAYWGIYSSAQYEAVGVEGMQKQPAGTGPWKFVKHNPGFGINWEAKEHYRKTPEFDEFNLILVPEASTRFAMLRAGEVNMVEIPRELHANAVANGFKVLTSLNPALQTVVLFGGNYRKDTPEYDPDSPLVNVKVREALNRAIDRDLIHKEIFKGVGEKQKLWIFHKKMTPWNPEWETRFDELYGYDPAKARQLIIDAGYDEGFSFDLMSFKLAGFPEMEQITEYLFGAFREIGLDPKIVEVDFGRLLADMRARKMNGRVWLQRTSWEPPFRTFYLYNNSPAVECCHVVHSYENKKIDDLYNRMLTVEGRAERDALLMEMGDVKYFDYEAAPMFWLPGQVIVDPNEIKGWVWSGRVDSVYSQFEYAEPA